IDRFGFGGFHGGFGGFHGGVGGFRGDVGGFHGDFNRVDINRVNVARVGGVGGWNPPYGYRGAWDPGAAAGAAAGRHGAGGWGGGRGLLKSLLGARVRILPLPALLLTKHANADGATEERAMTTTHPSDLQLQFKQAVRDHWVLFLIQGLVMTILGLFAVAAPV